MRRFVLAVLGSAILLSACNSSNGSPDASTAASRAPSAASTVAVTPTHAPGFTGEPTPVPSEPATLPGSDWITVAPVGAGFTSKFPAEPSQSSRTFSSAVGDAPAAVWILEENSDLALFAAEARYSKGSMSGVSASAVYDAFITAMSSSSFGISVDSEDSVQLNGHTGRAFMLTGEIASIKGQIYLVGDNLYVVYATYTAALADSPDIDTFIGTFKLTV